MMMKLRKLPYFIAVFVSVCLIVICVIISFRFKQSSGHESFSEYTLRPDGPDVAALARDLPDEYRELLDGQLYYQGEIYEYNENLLTFLILGIDGEVGVEKVPGTAGQADLIMLVVLDDVAKTIKVINVSRDIMTMVETYDTNGFYIGEEEKQIAIQYAYGDGMEKSARLMEGAVSNLFYGIPIHGYGAVGMHSVATLNDAVGGVEVYVIEDMSFIFPSLAYGNTVTLMGDEAFVYVQYRDTEIAESNALRNARQKQFLLGFFQSVKDRTRANITFPFKLYGIGKEHAVTSITGDQVAYLSTAVLGINLSSDDVTSVAGHVYLGGELEEFWVIEDELYDLIVNTFYSVVQ